MTTLVTSFLNGSSLFLCVTRVTIKARMNLNFCQIQQLTTELTALEGLKNQYFHFFAVVSDSIFYKLADKEEMHDILKDEFEFRPDWPYDILLPLTIQKIPPL